MLFMAIPAYPQEDINLALERFPVYVAEYRDGKKFIHPATIDNDLPAILAQIDDNHFDLAWATRAKCCYLLRFVTDKILKAGGYTIYDIYDALGDRLNDENEEVARTAKESYEILIEKRLNNR
jgi:hypothetical protein